MSATETRPGKAREMGPITVLLVEDDAPIRDLMARRLGEAPSVTLVDAVGSLAAARAAVKRHAPAVLLTDLRLPDGNAVELIRETRLARPETEIMVISVLCDERSVVDAIGAGASGFLLKDALPEDLVNAVHELIAGRSPISAAIARYIIRQVQTSARPAPADPSRHLLTQREIDILWGIAKGLTYGNIADSLGISNHTVATHIKSIYRKLEVNSGGEAVYEALSRKLIHI